MSNATPPLPEQQSGQPFDMLDQVIMSFTETDWFTIRDACQGIQIFGETGSGKTSGSGRHFALAYLRAGFGGLVLTANPDDTELWRRYAEETGRTADLLFFGQDYSHGFNFLHYETTLGIAGDSLTRNLVDLFQTVAEIGNGSGKRSATDDPYWHNELQKILASAIDLLRFADKPITLANIHKVILSAPTSLEQLDDEVFQVASFCFKCGEEVQKKMLAGAMTNRDAEDADITMSYWGGEFARLDPRPRGSIVGSFTGMADGFLRGRFRELFCGQTTVRPEESFDGKIIILDMPVKRWKSLGIYGQMIFKHCWQKAVERRQVQSLSRPVFLWADEAQYFVNSHDVLFQTTARSSRVCTVYLTQNLPNYYARLPGNGEALTQSLLGNLATKVFHSNTCAVTNRYAANLFGKNWAEKESYGFNYGEDSKANFSRQEQEELRDTILPREFSGMMSGGSPNQYFVEAIVNHAGRTFNLSGTNALKVLFHQLS